MEQIIRNAAEKVIFDIDNYYTEGLNNLSLNNLIVTDETSYEIEEYEHNEYCVLLTAKIKFEGDAFEHNFKGKNKTYDIIEGKISMKMNLFQTLRVILTESDTPDDFIVSRLEGLNDEQLSFESVNAFMKTDVLEEDKNLFLEKILGSSPEDFVNDEVNIFFDESDI